VDLRELGIAGLKMSAMPVFFLGTTTPFNRNILF